MSVSNGYGYGSNTVADDSKEEPTNHGNAVKFPPSTGQSLYAYGGTSEMEPTSDQDHHLYSDRGLNPYAVSTTPNGYGYGANRPQQSSHDRDAEDPTTPPPDRSTPSEDTVPVVDWNARFQSIWSTRIPPELRGSAESHHHMEELRLARELRNLATEFSEEACRKGVVIISELYSRKKSISPITNKVGGIAGGEKYLCGGIFFKAAIDKGGLYHSDACAMKAAGHELKGLMSILDCRVQGLHFPLVALIDYLGYRLMAQSLLPIDKDTLLYGSGDGAVTVRDEDPDLSAKMKIVGESLNLKPHWVWNREKKDKKYLYGPADVEGHKGSDGRYYILDTARVLPPSDPTGSAHKGSYLYRLFRPEFLKLNPVPLSSDAFSLFGCHDADVHDKEVREATARLRSVCILEMATDLDRRHENDESGVPAFDFETQMLMLQELVAELHYRGINCRYLMRLFSCLKSWYPRSLVVSEVVARSCRHILTDRWRLLRSANLEDYKWEALSFFNMAFGINDDGRGFWSKADLLEKEIPRWFEYDPSQSAVTIDDLKVFVNMDLVLARLQELTGVHFSYSPPAHLQSQPSVYPIQSTASTPSVSITTHPSASSLLTSFARSNTSPVSLSSTLGPQQSPSSFFALTTPHRTDSSPFAMSDMGEIAPRTKHISRISFQEGTALSKAAQSLSSKSPKEAIALFKEAGIKYQECLLIKPNDVYSLYNWGLSLSQQAKLVPLGHQADQLFAAAAEKYGRALVIHPADTKALTKWGTDLLDQARSKQQKGDVTQAISLLELALSKLDKSNVINPLQYHCLYNAGMASLLLAKLLLRSAPHPEASVASTSPSLVAHNSLNASGMDLEPSSGPHRVVALLNDSTAWFARALELNPKSSDACRNMAIAAATFARVSNQAGRDEQDRLYAVAYAAYEKAQVLEPSDPEIPFDWGNSLYRHAKTIVGPNPLSSSNLASALSTNSVTRALMLLFSATTKFHATLESNPSFKDALTNLGVVCEFIVSLWRYRPTEMMPPDLEFQFDQVISNYLAVIEKEVRLISDKHDLVSKGIVQMLGSLTVGSVGNHDFSWLKMSPLVTIGAYTMSPKHKDKARDILTLLATCENKAYKSLTDEAAASLDQIAALRAQGKKHYRIKEKLSGLKKSLSGGITSSSGKLQRSGGDDDDDSNPNLIAPSNSSPRSLPSASSFAGIALPGLPPSLTSPSSPPPSPSSSTSLSASSPSKGHVGTTLRKMFRIQKKSSDSSIGGAWDPSLPVNIFADDPTQSQFTLDYLEEFASVKGSKMRLMRNRNIPSQEFLVKRVVLSTPASLPPSLAISKPLDCINVDKLHALAHPFVQTIRLVLGPGMMGSSTDDDLCVYVCFDKDTLDKFNFVMKLSSFIGISASRLSESEIRVFAAQVGLGLGHLHSIGLGHWNLGSMRLTSDGYPCLTKQYCVFKQRGLYSPIESYSDGGNSKTSLRGMSYLAPEYVTGRVPLHEESRARDWWAFGVLLWSVLTGKKPFQQQVNRSQMSETFERCRSSGECALPMPPNASMELKDLIARLLAIDPAERLGVTRDFQEVKEHPFFSGTFTDTSDWMDLLNRSKPGGGPFKPYIQRQEAQRGSFSSSMVVTRLAPPMLNQFDGGMIQGSMREEM